MIFTQKKNKLRCQLLFTDKRTTMKRVIIVRHGKAVPYGYEDDFNRDLRERGIKDSRLISTELHRRGITADAIISSPAKRALKTARIFAQNLNFDPSKIVTLDILYEGPTTGEFLELIQQQPDELSTILFFGHNPGFHFFAANLLKHFRGDMPTTSTVGIDFEVNHWNEVEARTGNLAFHLVPRMFKQ